MSKKRLRFIINPKSGYANSGNIPGLLDKYLDHNKYEYSLVFTEYKGHAVELSAAAVKDGCDSVIACGGDGTVNEVAQALVHSNVSLGIIPNGSGNGFAMYIGMGRNTKRAILKLNNSQPRCIDSCLVNGRFFINLAGIGFDALIAYKAESGKKRGLQMYLTMVTQEMLRFKAENFRIKLDDEIVEGPFTTIAVANAPMYGYNFTIAPLADLSDGLLDTVFIKKASLARTIGASWRMLNRSLDKSPLVSIHKSKEVVISTDRPYYYHLDGESFIFDNELKFKINPRSINVLFPEVKSQSN